MPSSSRQRLAIRIGIALLVVALGVALVALARDTNSDPSDDSPEAGFSRAMADHHAQAVTMGDIIRDRTQDPVLKTTATDIVLTQQSQIGRMQGWLDVWGLPLTSTDPPMAWMGHEGPMPGMATRAEINSLSTLPVADAEIEFLRLMIAHHEGGIATAEAILERTDRDEVVNLATAIAESQRAEIIQMEQLLSDRGATT